MTDFWRNKTVLVTGIGGFVGSNLVKALRGVGAKPTGIDRYASSSSLRVIFGTVAHPYIAVADVTDLTAMMKHVDGVQPDVLYHLAGQGHIFDAQSNPWAAFNVNVLGTLAVLEAVRRVKPDTIVICASSNHAYIGGIGVATTTTLRSLKHLVVRNEGGYGYPEDAPLVAVDTYGSSKAMCDRAVACYRQSYGLRAVAVRHVNAYGPADPHATHLVTQSILACLGGAAPTLRGRGSAVKGYLHVADVVSAYLRIAERIDDLPGHAVNVASPVCEASVLQVMRTVCQACGVEPNRVQSIPGSVSDQEGYEERLDAALINSLEWSPRFTLHTGIADTVAWYSEHKGLAWLTT